MGTDAAGVRDIGRHAVCRGPVLRTARGRGALRLSLGLIALGGSLAPAGSSPKLISIPRAALCVTEGALTSGDGRRIAVDVPKMRAYVNQPSADNALLHVTYLGPTASQSALSSGTGRIQFGLKLHAADPCNLVYVMWRIEPQPKLVVSVKSNPGQHTSAQCGNRGYQNIKPQKASGLPPLMPGQAHTLAAGLIEDHLRVVVDEKEIWSGNLGSSAAVLSGPAGVRSDNARLEFELLADNAAPAAPSKPPSCRGGSEDSE